MEQKYTRGVSWSTFEPTGKLGYFYHIYFISSKPIQISWMGLELRKRNYQIKLQFNNVLKNKHQKFSQLVKLQNINPI